ncbi:MAG: zf-HC2 domain-containing protein [Actinomycetota bacterium]|nr:zf-HC2 domain-containing protein [Actinomycetota bacterium]
MTMQSLPEMARCLRTSRVLQAYLDGETDARTAGRVAHHLEDCRRCGLQASTYRAIKQVLAAGGGTVDELALHRLRAFTHSLSTTGHAGTDS